MMKFIADWFPKPRSRRDCELDYLNAAVSRYDLERREREIDRGKFAAIR